MSKTSLNRAQPANNALLTIAAMGAKAVANCAPCVILTYLDAEEIAQFRLELTAAEDAARSTRAVIDLHLASELSYSRED